MRTLGDRAVSDLPLRYHRYHLALSAGRQLTWCCKRQAFRVETKTLQGLMGLEPLHSQSLLLTMTEV